jgi:yecA family protein
MNSISTPLTVEQLISLDKFLIQRLGENPDTDYGVTSISELDGLFTAVVCSPRPLLPSQWLPALWGRVGAPEFGDDKHYATFVQLFGQYLEGISVSLKADSGSYSPILHPLTNPLGESIGETATPWAVGFMRGFDLAGTTWFAALSDIDEHLVPILLFGTPKGQESLAEMSADEQLEAQNAIAASVSAFYRYWNDKAQAQIVN